MTIAEKPGSKEGLLLLKQAINLFLQPQSGQVAPAARLADGMPFLLLIASVDQKAMAFAKTEISEPEDKIRNAAVDFLKQFYLQHTEDPYRVLGLNPWSTQEEVKSRYRLLIRLFHPDRGGVVFTSDEQDYAANINLAFTTISKKNPAQKTNQASRAAAASQNFKKDNEANVNASAKTQKMATKAHLVTVINSLMHTGSAFLKLLLTVYLPAAAISTYRLCNAILKPAMTTHIPATIRSITSVRSGKLWPAIVLLILTTMSIAYFQTGGNKTGAEPINGIDNTVSENEYLSQQGKATQLKIAAEKREAERQLALKQEQDKREAQKREAERLEVQRQLALKQEAEKREAERKATELKIAAEKREAERQLALKQEQDKREA
jgi:hypothetical protein